MLRRDFSPGRMPYHARLPLLEIKLLRGDKTRQQAQILGSPLDATIEYLTGSIIALDVITREKIVDAMMKRDEYVGLREQYFPQNRPDSETYFDVIDQIEPISGECFFNAHDSTHYISSLWEMSAFLTRTLFKFPIKARNTSLWTLLKHLYNDPRFNDLITHTEFSLTTNNQGHQIGSYKSGSVLDRLKNYRNMSTHFLWPYGDSVRSAESVPLLGMRSRSFSLYDPVSNQSIPTNVPTPEGLANLAEEAFTHYVRGYEIMESGMIRHLGV